jgi:serine/threonine protein kinase/formylglycine-generating enzyme required for sulfatase activity
MRSLGPEPEQAPPPRIGANPENGGKAGEEANDPLLDHLERWEERFLGDNENPRESMGIDDPALREALAERINAQKQLYEFLGLTNSPASEALSDGTEPTRLVPAPKRQGVASIEAGLRDLPQKIGRYQVRRALGQGGYGRVYLAHDADLDRLVAIKVPIAARASGLMDVEGYLSEARMLARLIHPNIVSVYDVGRTEDGLCYIVSRYMDGGDLASRLARGPYSFDESAGLVAALAEALHYAHTQDLFHRDIKPANILMDANGVPALADFGLALHEENFGKGAGVVGTTAYMSPEQARGEGHLVDGRSDIFSLAIVFYELLAGRRPFRGKTREDVVQKIIVGEVRPPRQIVDTIPRELERICLKALSKRAFERYSTAKDLADDLRHFLNGRADGARTELMTTSLMIPSTGAAGERKPSQANQPVASRGRSIKIVPRGLSSFDEQDADFFLELLPGPRDRNGLPEGLRFWKAKIEASDPDKTFRVGIIYGPSGCGKSSLIKAGLLPLLDQSHRVTSIYVEASGTETEARLLRGARKALRGLNEGTGLVATLAALRRGRCLPSGGKALVVVDQLEQWLFARQGEQGTELVDALRQCDGEHLLAICLVRDDFWMATTRFMRDLEIDLVPNRNIAAVDLFDARHARNVLAAYGRAYGVIAAGDGDRPREQNAFLDQAVAGLVQGGAVVPVRLALFALMIKGKPWTPATLREIGGTDGVGLKFLEETFGSARSSPKHRLHQVAAQAVLKSLLPETNADIKGRMRSIDELRGVSGYSDRADDFADLIRVLDNDLRLITPVDCEVVIDGQMPAHRQPGGRNYQLTHDYLVQPLRDWLTRKQRETRRGRAEALLAERSSLWSNKPERRYLPSLTEWARIRLLTTRKEWTEPQRRMIRHTDQFMALKTAATVVVLAGLYFGALAINLRVIEVRNNTHAVGLVRQLVKAEIAQVPAIVDEMQHLRRWTDPALSRILKESGPGSKEKLHASIALLPVREDQVAYLHDRLATADPATTAVMIGALQAHQGKLVDVLWRDLLSAKPNDRRILPTASLLADFDPANPGWRDVAKKIASAMVEVKLSDVQGWLEALWNVRAALANPLAEIYRDKGRPEIDHTIATTLLARYVADQPSITVDLLLDADPHSFSILFPVVRDNRSQAIAALRKALEATPVVLAVVARDQALAAQPAAEAQRDDSDRSKEELAARRAKAAVSLVRLGQADQVWQLLAFSPDPATRSTLINAFHTYLAPPALLIQELARLANTAQNDQPASTGQSGKNAYLFDPVISKKRALIQSLAAYPFHDLTTSDQGALAAIIIDVHRNDPDAGVHSAAELLLRRSGRDDASAVGSRPAAATGSPRLRWYVNAAGQTMVRIDGPVEFQMGSPPTDKEREDGDVFHRRRIPRAFAISTKEVSITEYQAFTKDTGRATPPYRRSSSPHDNGPQIKLTWYDAAAYCNWLSAKEGFKPCYEPIEQSGSAGGMTVNADAVSAGAYRLPTEAEWEYACLAGTTICRYCGRVASLLKYYEWYVDNSDDHAHPCGGLLPNELGLFDMLGNVMEWCHDGYSDPQRSFENVVVDAILPEVIHDSNRHYRGQSFYDRLRHVRAGTRGWVPPSDPRNDKGFRPARTLPAAN